MKGQNGNQGLSSLVFEKSSRRLLLVLAGLVLLTLFYWLLKMQGLSHAVSSGNEGIITEGARRVFRGEVPCRDFFSSGTPGAYYFYAGIFKLFGPSFFALRLGVVLVAFLNLCAV